MVNETTKRLTARVKQLRLASGFTQEQFAERADLDPKFYQHLEAGRKLNPEMETLIKLAKGCGVELWELFKFDLPLPALAEDPAKYGGKASKGTAKPTKRRAEKSQA